MREKFYYSVRVTAISVKHVCVVNIHVKWTFTRHLTQHPKRNNLNQSKRENKPFPFVSGGTISPDTDLTQTPVHEGKVKRKFLNVRRKNSFVSLLETGKTPYKAPIIGFSPAGWLMCVR